MSSSEVGGVANIHLARYQRPTDVSLEEWTSRPKADRLEYYARQSPTSTTQFKNTTTIGLHEYLPALLNRRNDLEAILDHPARIAFGDDPSSTSRSDRSLNNRVGSVVITDPTNSVDEWRCNELVGALELNGENLRELAVESESGEIFNHAPIPEGDRLEPKTESDELIARIVLRFVAP